MPALRPTLGDATGYSPSGDGGLRARATVSDSTYNRGRSAGTFDQNIVEAWSQGLLFGTTMVLIMFTVANMRRNVLLHKLILIELCFILGHGTFIFCPDPVYGWYLSSTAVLLYQCWPLHNVIAWLKNRPFLPLWGSRLYIFTVALTYPFWIAETILNFYWFNSLGNDSFRMTRPFETFFRDPWWIFTTFSLIYIIHRQYSMPILTLIKSSPRFGVLMACMFFAIVFAMADLAVSFKGIGGVNGINPYWKLSTVFKCASDTLFLDDFKKVLDQLTAVAMESISGESASLRDVITSPGDADVAVATTPIAEMGGFEFGGQLAPTVMPAVASTKADGAVGVHMHRGRRGSGGGGRAKKRSNTLGSLFKSPTRAEEQTVGGVGDDVMQQVLREGPDAAKREGDSVDAGDVRRLSSGSRRTFSPIPSRLLGTGNAKRVEWFDMVGEDNVVLDDYDDEDEKEKPEDFHGEDLHEIKNEKAVEEERARKGEDHNEMVECEEVEFADVGGLATGTEKR